MFFILCSVTCPVERKLLILKLFLFYLENAPAFYPTRDEGEGLVG